MKNVLVIGGSYFVGRVFVEELAGSPDHRVFIVNRGNRPLDLERVQEIVCDRNDAERLREVLPRINWHAVVDFCGYRPGDITSVLSALPAGSVQHYIFVSTTSVYAPTRALPIREDAPKLEGPQPELGPAADYGFQKWLSEQAVADRCVEKSIPFTCLRPSIIYGKYNYAPRESYFFDKILHRETVVLPDNDLALFQFVSVWDVAELIGRCMANPDTFGSSYNLCAEDLISYSRFVEVLEGIAGRKLPKKRTPIPVIEAERIPLPFPLDSHLIYSGDRIRETLGFRYMSFESGMERTYAWYFQVV